MKKCSHAYFFFILSFLVSCSLFLEDDHRQLHANDYATILGDTVSQVLFFSDAGNIYQDTSYQDSVHLVGKRIRFAYKILNTKNNITFINIEPNYLLFSLIRLETKPYLTDTAVISSLDNVNFTPKYGGKGEYHLNIHGTAKVDTLNFSNVHIVGESNKFVLSYLPLFPQVTQPKESQYYSFNISCDVGKLEQKQSYSFRYQDQSTQQWEEKEIHFIQDKN